jgi:hypothetical protein
MELPDSPRPNVPWHHRIIPRFGLRSLLLAFVVIGLGLTYVGSYISRSYRGRYEPMLIGLGGVKGYSWAPQGFVTDFVWDFKLLRWYYPIYRLDVCFWHTSRDEGSGKYPINEVPPEEIGRVYKAWRSEAARLKK